MSLSPPPPASYAETAINDADIVFSMEIVDILDSTFVANILGSIDNRNVFGATMDSTVITLGFQGQVHHCSLLCVCVSDHEDDTRAPAVYASLAGIRQDEVPHD